MSSRKKLSGFFDRVHWMVDNSLTWYKFGENLHRTTKAMIKLMKKDGLVAPTTYWLDCAMKNEIKEARFRLATKTLETK